MSAPDSRSVPRPSTPLAAPPADRREVLPREELPPLVLEGVPGFVRDVSRTGVSLMLSCPVNPGTRWPLRLVDALDGSSQSFDAEVVSCRNGRARLDWTGLTPEQDAWLAERFVTWAAALEGASRR